MLEKYPNRKKDKYNPYTLTIAEGHYYLSFKGGRGKQQNICSSTRRIFDGVAVATDRKSNAVDGRIDKEVYPHLPMRRRKSVL